MQIILIQTIGNYTFIRKTFFKISILINLITSFVSISLKIINDLHDYSAKKRKMSENNQQPEQSQQIDNLQTENELIPEKGDKIVLRFQLAEDKKIPGLDHIDVTFEGAQIRKLWNNFHKNKGSQESEITQEEMETFHKALRTHARNTLKLCLDDRSIFILTQVRLSTY